LLEAEPIRPPQIDKVEEPQPVLQAPEPRPIIIPQQEPVQVETTTPKTEEEIRREKLLRSYSQAVVNDATQKVQTFIEIGDTFKAKQAVRNAAKVIDENRERLGEELYQTYMSKLNELSQKIE
ncbi:MAG: hypothetical protein ACYTFK_13355, partial [Planctomycetota bacterium]